MANEADLVLGIDGTGAAAGAATVKRNLASVKTEAREAVTQINRVEGSFDRLRKAAFSLGGIISGLSFAVVIRELQQYSDKATLLEGRLKLVTNSTAELARTQERLFNIAQDTRSSYEATVKLFTRIALSSRQLGQSQENLLRITEIVNKALQVGGATTAEAAAGTIQLSQALAAGTLRGDEFRSVLENMPRVTRALEDALGKTRGELIAMAQAGQLSSRQVAEALLKMGGQIDEEFSRLPITIGQAFQKLDNAFLRYIGRSDAVRAGSNSIALAISGLAENFELLAGAVGVAAVAYSTKLLTAYVASSTQTVNTMRLTFALTAAQVQQATTAVQVAQAELAKAEALAAGNLGLSQSAAATVAAAEANLALARAQQAAAANSLAMAGAMAGAAGTGARLLAVLRGGLVGAVGFLASPAGIAAVVASLFLFGNQLDDAAAKGNRLAQALRSIREWLAEVAAYIQGQFLAAVDNFSLGLSYVLEGLGLMEDGVTQLLYDMQQQRKAWKDAQTGAEAAGKAIGEAGATAAHTVEEIEKLTKALEDALNRARYDRVTAEMNDLEKALVDIDTIVQKAGFSMSELNAEQRQLLETTREQTKENVKFKLIMENRTPLEKYRAEVEKLERLRPIFGDDIEAVQALDRAIAKLGDDVNPLAEVFAATARGIHESFTDMFRDLLDGVGGFKSFTRRLLDVFKDMVAQMATLALANPVIIPIVTGLGGALGLSAGSIEAVTGQLGGGALSQAGGAGGVAGLLGSLMRPAINPGVAFDIGSYLGLNAGTVGALHTGLANFTPAAGLAGFGGNFLANTLLGNRGAGAGIGGTVGGIAGTFIGGPIGAAIGSFLGNAVGGLFGNSKPSNMTQTVGVNLATGATQYREDLSLTGGKFSQKNLDSAQQLAAAAAQLARVIAGPAGLAETLNVSVGSVRGLQLQFGGDPALGYGQDVGGFIRGLVGGIVDRAPEVGQSLMTAISNIDFSKAGENLEALLSDIAFAAGFDKLGQAVPPATQLGEAMKALNEQFDTMAETARRLGLEEAKVQSTREAAVEALRAGANKSVYDMILEITNPRALAGAQERERYETQLREIQAINGDILGVEILHKLKLREIEKQYTTESLNAAKQTAAEYRSIAQSLTDSIFGLRTGSLSTLSPLAKYQEAGAAFQATLARALAGDGQAAGELANIGRQFLDLSQAYNSSNEIFARDFQQVQSGLEQARAVAERQASLQEQIASGIERQTGVLESGFNSLLQVIAQAMGGALPATISGMVDAYTGRTANAAGRSLSDLTGSGLTVGQHEAVARAVLGGYTGPSGAGELQRMLDQRGLQSSFASALRAAGAQGFASGGYTTAGKPFIVGENRPEIMASRDSAMIIPFQQNAAILRELQASNRHTQAQVRVLQEGFLQLVDTAHKTEQNTSRLAESAALNSRRRA